MKKICLLILLVFTVVQITGCANNSAKVTSNDSETGYKKNSNDETEGTEVSYDIQGMEIIDITADCADRAIGSSLDSLAENSTEVVRGAARNIAFVGINGEAWTKVDVEITETLSGNLMKGDMVSIYLLGGYIWIVNSNLDNFFKGIDPVLSRSQII